jgi:alpha-glucosidase (family GH31 glycosyl hydrolase)
MITRTSLILVTLFTATLCMAEPFEGAANPAATVVRGDVRFTMLTPQLIRMEWSANGAFEDRPSLAFIRRNMAVPKFAVDEASEWLTIKTDKLTLRYRKGSGKFTAGNLSIAFDLNGSTVTWHPGLDDPLNLKGTTRTLDGTNGARDVHLEDGILSRSGWALVDDSERPLYDNSASPWVVARPDGERQDWYFFGYGHDYKLALRDFTRVAGRIPIPPKYVFGYWWSRYWSYSDTDLRRLIGEMRDYGLPIDVLIIDMDWHITDWPNAKPMPDGGAYGWTGYTWNRGLFPDPKKFLDWTKAENLKVALNLHPASGIAPMEEKYADFARAFGVDPAKQEYIPFAIDNRKWAEAYFSTILHPMEREGIDFWWLDWQQYLVSRTTKNLSNTFWLNYTFFTDMERQGRQRPFIYHRWGGLGNHRYPLGFSGDTWGTWESLDFQPYFTATSSNVGYGYWGHDLGGHMNIINDPELYTRWIQFGALSPIFKTHSTKSAALERRYWRNLDEFPLRREAVELRYALAPYIYNAAREAYDTGISLCRPMYYDYPESPEAYDFKGQYMFGDDILAAPVTTKSAPETGLAPKKIWLPEGEWFEWTSGTPLKGGRVIDRDFAGHEIPMYMKAGAIIPMYPKIPNLQEPVKTLIVTAIPGANGQTRLYEDDGSTSAYLRKQYAFTTIRQQRQADGAVRVTIEHAQGAYQGMPQARSYEIRLPASLPPAQVTVNGRVYPYSLQDKTGTWTYGGEQLATRILTPPLPVAARVEVTVRPVPGLNQRLAEGKAQLFGRAPAMTELIRNATTLTPPRHILDYEQGPAVLAYNPDKAAEFLSAIDRDQDQAAVEVVNIPGLPAEDAARIVAQLFPGKMLLASPAIKLSEPLSTSPAIVEIASANPGVEIRYTTDGSVPVRASQLYSGPFQIDRTATVRARAFQPGAIESVVSRADFTRTSAKSVKYQFEPRGPSRPFALVDGRLGDASSWQRNWVAFDRNDLVATLELPAPRDVAAVTTRFLANAGRHILPPSSIKVEVSSDGVTYRTAWELETPRDGDDRVRAFKAQVNAQGVKYIRVTAKNAGGLLLSDEIVIE